MTDRTDGFLLGGRVRYAQPRTGFRSGIEPVLLAAAIPARSGELVLEGGSGAGAALLCLASRVAGIDGVGVEQDPALVDLARENAAANGLDRLHFRVARVEAIPETSAFSHAFANPPYHLSSGTRSPVTARDRAKHAPEDALCVWTAALASRLQPRGTLTLITPAARFPACLAALQAARCGSVALLPLWPREGEPAKLVLVQAVKLGSGPFRVLSGLTLHTDPTGYTRAADAVLRDGEALTLQR